MDVKQLKLDNSYKNGAWPFRIVVRQGKRDRYYYPKAARGRKARKVTVKLGPYEPWPDELRVVNGSQTKKYQLDKSMDTSPDVKPSKTSKPAPAQHESATEQLRRLLRECEVPYNNTSDNVTFWGKGEGTTIAAACQGALWVSTLLTPEQVADKMLRRSVCHNVHEPPKNGLFWPCPHFKCSECGATHVSMDYVYYCPKCGREVVDEWE